MVQFEVGRSVNSNMVAASGGPIFGLDMRDAGQSRHLRRPSKTNFHDQSVTEPSVRTSL